MRIAWARLGDSQRSTWLRQLAELVGDREGVLERVHAFIQTAFKTRKYKSTREIARDKKIKRIERRHRRASDATTAAVERLDADERARLARRMRGEKER